MAEAERRFRRLKAHRQQLQAEVLREISVNIQSSLQPVHRQIAELEAANATRRLALLVYCNMLRMDGVLAAQRETSLSSAGDPHLPFPIAAAAAERSLAPEPPLVPLPRFRPILFSV